MWEAIAAIGALIAAMGAAWAAFETRRTASGPLLLQLMERYGSHEMNSALELLAEWRTKYGVNVAAAFEEAKRNSSDEWRDLNLARRQVKSHFLQIHDLFEARALTWRAARQALSVAGFELFEEVVMPLEATTAHPREERYEQLVKVRGDLERRWRYLRGDFS